MVIVKVYDVLDEWQVEISCVHGPDSEEPSHLVYREGVRVVERSLEDLLASTQEALVRAYLLTRAGDLETCERLA